MENTIHPCAFFLFLFFLEIYKCITLALKTDIRNTTQKVGATHTAYILHTSTQYRVSRILIFHWSKDQTKSVAYQGAVKNTSTVLKFATSSSNASSFKYMIPSSSIAALLFFNGPPSPKTTPARTSKAPCKNGNDHSFIVARNFTGSMMIRKQQIVPPESTLSTQPGVADYRTTQAKLDFLVIECLRESRSCSS